MKNLFGGFILLVICTLLGAIVAVVGAQAVGLNMPQSASWNLEPLIYVALGMLVASMAFLILLAVLPSRKDDARLGTAPAAFVGAIVLAFFSGIVGFRIAKHNDQKNSEKYKALAVEAGSKRDDFHSLLRKDPELAIRERWYDAKDERHEAYRHSLWQRDVAYSPEALATLYAVSDGRFPQGMMKHVLAHPAFDSEVLRSEFHYAILETLSSGECWRLIIIIESPKFERPWLEEIGVSGLFDSKDILCVGSLRQVIAKRFPPS